MHSLLWALVGGLGLMFVGMPVASAAGAVVTGESLDLTGHPLGLIALIIFVLAYVLVIFEEAIHMRKSKPVMLAGGIIWALIAFAYMGTGKEAALTAAAKHAILEYGELFLFLMVAITYVNTLEERRVFDVLRSKLVGMGLTYRQLFILTGILSFFLSPLLDNLTTSLIMGAVVMAVGAKSPKFIMIACVNVVVAANAGGAYSPFGDITTLMVWQKGKIEFFGFMAIFVPSVINYIIPAAIMYMAVQKDSPEVSHDGVTMKPGAKGCIILFACTIITAVSFKNFFHLPPAIGMMLGLGYLMMFSYFLKKESTKRQSEDMFFDSFKEIERVEWDTLLFFFGIIFAVGGLGVIGYLELLSDVLYVDLGATWANSIIGALSAIVDNIPLMFAVLSMDPAMSHNQWLLITLTCGVGGSLLSIGSAAGVALMGTARGYYTFASHLKWTWAIAIGYVASIFSHLLINGY